MCFAYVVRRERNTSFSSISSGGKVFPSRGQLFAIETATSSSADDGRRRRKRSAFTRASRRRFNHGLNGVGQQKTRTRAPFWRWAAAGMIGCRGARRRGSAVIPNVPARVNSLVCGVRRRRGVKTGISKQAWRRGRKRGRLQRLWRPTRKPTAPAKTYNGITKRKSQFSLSA